MTVSANSYAKETAYRLRLSNLIKPSIQQINLKVDPDSPTFKGGTTITIDVTKATDTVFLLKKPKNKQAYLTNNDTRKPLTVTYYDYEIQHNKASQNIAANR